MIRKLIAASAVAALSVTLAAATPAQAAWSDCGNFPETICLFQHANWGTPIWRQTPDQIIDYGSCRPLYGFNDVTTIAANNTSGGYSLRVWQHGDCTGWHYSINSGTHLVLTGAANDEVSGVNLLAF